MIDWLDAIGATNIVASMAAGYFGTDQLYFKPKTKRQLAQQQAELSEIQRTKQNLENLSTQVRDEIDLFNQRTKEEERKRELRNIAECLYDEAQSQPLDDPPHGTVHDYLNGCRCEACMKALRRHGLIETTTSSATEVHLWGGGVIKGSNPCTRTRPCCYRKPKATSPSDTRTTTSTVAAANPA